MVAAAPVVYCKNALNSSPTVCMSSHYNQTSRMTKNQQYSNKSLNATIYFQARAVLINAGQANAATVIAFST